MKDARIEVDFSCDQNCHVCKSVALLVARVPHTLTRSDGVVLNGTRSVVLCPTCDRDDPAAQGILAYFAVNESVSEQTAHTLITLLRDWANRIIERGSPAPGDGQSDAEELEIMMAEIRQDEPPESSDDQFRQGQ